MEQYLQALRDGEDVSEEQIAELEERFKPEEIIIPDPEPEDATEIEILRNELDEYKKLVDTMLGVDKVE